MQGVIFAAGEGLRMRPLTLDTPKPLLKVASRPLIQHIVESLPLEIDELLIVIGYLGDKIRAFCGERFLGRKVRYVFQEKKLGTADALKRCRPYLKKERFLVLNGDDLFHPAELYECLKYKKALLVAEHHEPQRFGVVTLREDGTIARIVEKPEAPESNIVSTGALLTDEKIFDFEPERHPNGEYYVADMLDKMIRSGERVWAVKTAGWFPIATPEDLLLAENFLKEYNRLT
jgi:NDP-sugar pyrophosphorylase family protein